jgi:hypothetical protein
MNLIIIFSRNGRSAVTADSTVAENQYTQEGNGVVHDKAVVLNMLRNQLRTEFPQRNEYLPSQITRLKM